MWYLSNFIGNYFTGYLGTFYEKMPRDAFFVLLGGLALGRGNRDLRAGQATAQRHGEESVKAVFLLIFAAMLFAAPVNEQAASSGEAWLKLIDNGKYADSWKEASSYFRSRVPQKTWVSMVQGVRAPLGSLVSRSQPSVTFAKALPGLPGWELRGNAVSDVLPEESPAPWKR